MSHDTPSDHAALAAAATTSPGATPNFGLAWDLSTGQWMNATEFRQFARSQMPLTQSAATQRAKQLRAERLYEQELQRARNFEQGGLFKTDAELLLDREGVGNQILRGFKAIGGYGGQFFDHILSGGNRDDERQLENAYAKYAKKGGLLSRAEFESFSPGTQLMLLEKGALGDFGRELLEIPGAERALVAAERYVYRPAIAFAEIILDPDHAEWNALFSSKHWGQAWREAQGESLGNALIDGIFESAGWADDDTLTRWKRDNPWYQMSSVGAEFAVAWYADPLVVGGKALGGAARLKKNELPIRTDSRQSIAIRQRLQGQNVTAVRNPITKQYVNFRVARIDDAKKQVEDYIRAGATVTDLTRMPMFQSRSRVVDGGLAANTLHYAVTKQDELNQLINSPRVREGLEGEMPEHLDILDLTWRLYFGDAQAWAMFNKLERVAPDELLEIAPGAGELIDRVKSLRTRHETLESEIESLLADKAKWEVPGEEPSLFHRWEVESDLTVKQAQFADSTDALSRYEGYKEFLEDLNTSKPHLTRVSKPGHKRFSQARSRTDEVETRRIFAPNFYGRGHSFTKIPKALFIKRANQAELHDVDSTVTSINRQFDQMAHLFRYAPEGVRDDYIQRAIRADEYGRYRLLYEIEEKHFVAAAAQRFEVDEDVIRAILNRVHDERNKTMQGILRGDDSRFGSAASLGERIRKGDQSIQLVSRNDDEGTVRIRVMHGRDIDEYELPKEALFTRVGPQDVTELPNYYTPLDHRAVYYQLKHNPEMLDTLRARSIQSRAAAAAEAARWAGDHFNKFWKPYQLFRAAWPMRVLMDEGMRAMAILGPMYWLKNDGMEALLKTVPNTAKYAADRRTRKRQGGIGTSMAGPTVPKRANANVFQRDHQIRTNTPVLPATLYPRLDPDRYSRARDVSQKWHDWHTRRVADRQWYRKGIEGPALRARPATPLQAALGSHGRDRAERFAARGMARDERPAHPALKIYQSVFDARVAGGGTLKLIEKPKVYDPISAKEVRSGYFVPTAAPFKPTAGDDLELVNWYQENAELLGRQGMRIMVTADPETGFEQLVIGRWFSAGDKKGKYTQARDFAEYVSDNDPNVRLWHLHRPGHYDVVRPAGDSPAREAMHRYFASEEFLEQHRTEGAAAPMTGPDAGKEVYHGTSAPDGLPDPLLPRDEVEVTNGNMIGRGLYTTRSQEVAESPAYSGGEFPYVVMDSRTGERYDPFDLDQAITQRDIDDFIAWTVEQDFPEQFLDRDAILDEMAGSPVPGQLTFTRPDGKITWANVYENLDANALGSSQDILHNFLEQRRGAGVLTHKGGTTHSHPHQVYVWLHPENLVVKPLFTETSRFVPFARWIDGNDDFTPVENYLDEKRIIRKKPEPQPIAALPEGSNPERGEMRAREVEATNVEAMDPSRAAIAIGSVKGELLRAGVQGAINLARRYKGKDPIKDFDDALDSPYAWLMNQIRNLAEQGVGYRTIESSDGKKIKVESAYNGHRGQLFRALASSNGVLDVLSEGHGSGSSYYRRRSEGWRAYEPPVFTDAAINSPRSRDHKKAVRYFQVYADTVNDHFGHSPIAQKISKGWSNDRIIDWLDETPEGMRVRDTIKPDFMTTAQWVDEYQEKFFYAVPNPMLRRLLGKGRLAPSDFRKHVPDEDLPTIYGPDFEVLDRRRNAAELLNDFADKVYHALGTVPIDHLSRHPYAKAMYDVKMKELIGATDSKFLTQEAIEHFQELSRRHAMNEVRRTLYTLLDVTNFTDALRFIAPFWGAQYEAITKWGRIIANRPETVARFFAGQRALYENFVVWDEEGQTVRTPFREGGLHNFGIYQPEDRVIMPLPGFIANRFPGLKEFGQVGIPIGSANTVLQGEMPLLPGLGPLVTVPADLFLKAVDDTYGVENNENLIYKWFFPVGRPRSDGSFGRMMEQISPGWARRMQQAGGSQNNTARFNMEMQVGREMRLRAEREGKPMPTDAEISAAADFMWAVRGVASFVAPAQVQFLPKHQYWVDAYHRMEKEYGFEAQDKFLEKYGEEAAAYAISSSNSLGIPATSKGMVEWEGNKALIGKYPDWAKAIISPEAWMDDFNPDAYGQQFNIPVRPGSSERLRSVVDVQDRLQTQPEILLGWREYRKLAAAVEAELANNGWTSLQQKDAEGLRLYKRDMIAAIKQKYPAWGAEYDDHGNTINSRVAQLYNDDFQRFLARNQQRPDLRGLSTYLSLRAQTVAELERWAAQGGSPSLQSDQNGALRGWFYNQVGQLILDNPAFAEFYTRYLEGDTLELGAGGYGVPAL